MMSHYRALSIIFEKFLSLFFVILMQLGISWKFGVESYASFIGCTAMFASFNFLNVNSDLSFSKLRIYTERKLEVYDIFSFYRAVLLVLSFLAIFLINPEILNVYWMTLLLVQYICDALSANRILYNSMNGRVVYNIISSTLRIFLLGLLLKFEWHEREFAYLTILINIIWLLVIIFLSDLGGLRISKFFHCHNWKTIIKMVKSDLGYFHIIGFMTLLIGRGDIILFSYISNNVELLALVGAIAMAVNTISIALASLMPLNLAIAKSHGPESFSSSKHSKHMFQVVGVVTLGGLLLIATSELWLKFLMPSFELGTYNYSVIIILSLLIVALARGLIQLRMSHLIIHAHTVDLFLKVTTPPVIIGALLFMFIYIQFNDDDVGFYYNLLYAKLFVTFIWYLLAENLCRRLKFK